MSAPADFTFDWYRAFLRQCKLVGDPIPLGLAESAPKGSILLRHDVDYDLDPAIALSRIEEEEGVRSTFLVLVSTAFYNVASSAGREALRDLIARGFEVGLHFDPEVHAGEPMETAFSAERAFLESITHRPLRSVSLHNPTSHGQYPLFESVVNAYDPRWFGGERYLSDSSRRWRRDPLTALGAGDFHVLQVLSHPIHFSESGETYRPRFQEMARKWGERLHGYALRYNATYRDECER